MFNVNDIKNGLTLIYEGQTYLVMEFSHVKPGKGAAFVQAKLKNLKTSYKEALSIINKGGISFLENELSKLYESTEWKRC